MKKNVGGAERWIRIVLGVFLIVLGYTEAVCFFPLGTGLGICLGTVLAFLVGFILLITGIVERCPLSRVLGINTYHEHPPREGYTPKE